MNFSSSDASGQVNTCVVHKKLGLTSMRRSNSANFRMCPATHPEGAEYPRVGSEGPSYLAWLYFAESLRAFRVDSGHTCYSNEAMAYQFAVSFPFFTPRAAALT